MRKEIKEKLNIELLNAEALFEDLRRRKFTGYVRITTWDGEDYIPFYEGEIYKIFIIAKGVIEETTYSNYGFPQTGMVEIVETDPLSVLNGLRRNFSPEKDGPLCLAGYGEEFQPTSPASHIDFTQFLSLSKKSHFNGYLLFHTQREPVGMVFFYNGEPVGIFASDRSGERALQYIRANLKGSYVSILLLEPDLIPLLLATGKLEPLRRGQVSGAPELEAVRDEIAVRRMSALLYLDGGRNKRYYQFFYKGQEVKGLLQEMFSIEEVEPGEVDFPGELKVYPLYVDISPKVINLSLKTSAEVVDRVPPDKLNHVKEAFIDEIGPIGKLIWKKVLNEFGWDEEAVPVDRFEEFISRLAEEIPYDVHKEAFLKRVRRS